MVELCQWLSLLDLSRAEDWVLFDHSQAVGEETTKTCTTMLQIEEHEAVNSVMIGCRLSSENKSSSCAEHHARLTHDTALQYRFS